MSLTSRADVRRALQTGDGILCVVVTWVARTLLLAGQHLKLVWQPQPETLQTPPSGVYLCGNVVVRPDLDASVKPQNY